MASEEAEAVAVAVSEVAIEAAEAVPEVAAVALVEEAVEVITQ